MSDSSAGSSMFNTVDRAVADIAAGRPVVVVDDADRENEGDLIVAAGAVSTEWLAFMVRYTSGVVCVALPGAVLDRLKLPPMVEPNEDPKCTAFSVSVDLREGVSTGISAADRGRTIRALVDPRASAEQFSRPGHVFPLRAQEGGVLERAGHTEAAIDLTRLAGLAPGGAISEIVNEDGSMMRLPDLMAFARRHELSLLSIEDLIAYRHRSQRRVRRMAEARLPTADGQFLVVGYLSPGDGREHVALMMGEVGDGENVLVRMHSECLTGDAFASLRCDCGGQLRSSIRAVAAEGRGIVLYLGGHEGRGIGLLAKLQAYALQDSGHDTVEANLALGLPADARSYGAGAQILTDLGVKSVRLLTNNPSKRKGLEAHGIAVHAQIPILTPPTSDNFTYLLAKRDRMGHALGQLKAHPALTAEHSPKNPCGHE